MRACYIESFGGPEKLICGEVPEPRVGEKDVLVQVMASGICYHDTLTRKGVFPRTKLPVILGHQVSGKVVQVGPRVTSLRPGDRVLCLPFATCGECEYCLSGREPLCEDALFIGEEVDGGYAEWVALPENAWVKIPDNVDDDTASVLACSLGTAYHAAKTIAKIHKDETVVVTGASGGIGTHVIEVLRWIGARVIAVTGSAAKVSYLKQIGADEVVVHDNGSYAKKVKMLTQEKGADCVLDIVGGSFIHESLKSLKRGGRMVVIGNVSGQPAELKPAVLILKEVSILGTKGVTRREMEEILDLLGQGAFHVRISEVHGLEQVSDIHRRMQERDTTARIVIHPYE